MIRGTVKASEVERATAGESVIIPLANGRVMILRVVGEQLRLTEAPSRFRIESDVTPGE